tara:strand:+ start:62577 stop:62726 length:150 start_codon:yes stop_codon:yes gene_type:complete
MEEKAQLQKFYDNPHLDQKGLDYVRSLNEEQKNSILLVSTKNKINLAER